MKCALGTVVAEQAKVTISPGFPKSSLLIGLEWLRPSVINYYNRVVIESLQIKLTFDNQFSFSLLVVRKGAKFLSHHTSITSSLIALNFSQDNFVIRYFDIIAGN